MSEQAESYFQVAAMLIELASAVDDSTVKCELIDTALLYERLADFAAEREAVPKGQEPDC
jgi:hypothetical protein